MGEIGLNFTFDWLPVNKKDGSLYLFPDDANLIENGIDCPAIYIWSIFRSEFNDAKIIYIGQTENLIRRIKGYIKPGSDQQTNIRLNNLFKNYLREGYNISLNRLVFDEIRLNNIVIEYGDLYDNNIREALEQIFIVIYKKENYELLNK